MPIKAEDTFPLPLLICFVVLLVVGIELSTRLSATRTRGSISESAPRHYTLKLTR
jgi:hypothetical protein